MSELEALLKDIGRHAIISATALCDEAGISYDTWRSWQVGRRNPSPASLRLLAEALKTKGERLRHLAVRLEGHIHRQTEADPQDRSQPEH